MATGEPLVSISDFIEAIRDGLESAEVRGRDRRLHFEVHDVQLELEVMTSGTRGAGGGLDVWVLSVGAQGSMAHATTHKVTLKMSAVTKDGSRIKVSDTSSTPIRRKSDE